MRSTRITYLSKALAVIIGVVFVGSLSAQNPRGEYQDRVVRENLDTAVRTRSYGDWWFGASGGIQVGSAVGSLNAERVPGSPQYGTLGFSGGSLNGYSLGLVGEYVPVESFWGVQLKLHGLDAIDGSTSQIIQNSAGDKTYEIRHSQFAVRASPVVFMALPGIEGLRLSLGGDVIKPYRSASSYVQSTYNTERLEDFRTTNLAPSSLRWGANVGLSYDIFFATSESYRYRLAPFAQLSYLSPLVNANGSSWGGLTLNAGLTLKFGADVVTEFTLPFDSLNIPFLDVKMYTDGSFDIFSPSPRSERFEPEDAIILASASNSDSEISSSIKEKKDQELAAVEKRPPVAFNQPRGFTYKETTATGVPKSYQSMLDDIVEFLKSHPRAEVRIIGHTDAFGTAQETQDVSDERAAQVARYFERKGISRLKILASGMGSRRPIANNITSENRARNRRVEIVAIQR